MIESPYSAPESAAPPPPESWWKRNLKWLLPVGCGGCGVLFTALFVVLVMLIFSFMKSSGAYVDAVARAKADAAVQEALGTPIEEGWFVTGNVTFDGTSGDADLAIPISGPKDKATIYVLAEKGAGEWDFSTLEVKIKSTGETIKLVDYGDPFEDRD